MAVRLTFDRDGAAHHPGFAAPLFRELERTLSTCLREQAGVRLNGLPGLSPMLSANAPFGRIAAARLGPRAKPVRAILFDKSPDPNWALGGHQDRTIAVRMRHELPGFAPWSVKAGIPHVEPPFDLIERMVTLRIHLDDVPPGNAPLLLAPGSHRFGRIAEREVEAMAVRCGTATCCAKRGDVWAYATPILHASAVSAGHAHRRVLQVDFSADSLPEPLGWHGV